MHLQSVFFFNVDEGLWLCLRFRFRFSLEVFNPAESGPEPEELNFEQISEPLFHFLEPVEAVRWLFLTFLGLENRFLVRIVESGSWSFSACPRLLTFSL